MRTRVLVAGALTAALLTGCTGCAQSVDPIERLGKKAAQEVRRSKPNGPTPAAYRHWGLPAPLAPAPRPPARHALRGAGPGLAPVVDRVPTRDKVVFLTYDDGAERDPRFVDMVRELRLPVSMFLTDSVVGPGYGHFAQLRTVGASVQNHTLHHASLRGLPYAGQRAEICGQQDKLKARFGVRPRLFRPPTARTTPPRCTPPPTAGSRPSSSAGSPTPAACDRVTSSPASRSPTSRRRRSDSCDASRRRASRRRAWRTTSDQSARGASISPSGA